MGTRGFFSLKHSFLISPVTSHTCKPDGAVVTLETSELSKDALVSHMWSPYHAGYHAGSQRSGPRV